MSLNKLSDRVYYLPHEEETDRPILGYVIGDKYTLGIDAGNSKEHVNKLYDSLKELGFEEPDYTAITHWHWDHTFGMHAISGKSIACNYTNEKLIEVSKWAWRDEDMKERVQDGTEIEFCDKYIKVEYKDRNDIKVVTSDIIFDTKLTIDLGGVHCILMQVIAPHSDDSVLIYIPEEKIIFVGDADFEDSYNPDVKYDKERVESYIKTIKDIDFDKYIISHDKYETKEEVLIRLQDLLNNI